MRGGGGKEEERETLKKQQVPANVVSVATQQQSPPACEEVSSGRGPWSRCLPLGQGWEPEGSRGCDEVMGSGAAWGLSPVAAVLSRPPPPSLLSRSR